MTPAPLDRAAAPSPVGDRRGARYGAPGRPGAGASLLPRWEAPAQSSPPPEATPPLASPEGAPPSSLPYPHADAGTPAPGSGEGGPLLDPSPRRGRTPQAPAGASTPLAGSTSRTWTIALPAGLKLLSLNGREHWSERARRTEALKKAAWAVTLQARVPRLERVSVTVEYQPPDGRHRDAENTCAASGKACIDGIVAAGVLEDDECPRYVTGIWCTIGEPYPKGRLVLHLTEVAGFRAGAV